MKYTRNLICFMLILIHCSIEVQSQDVEHSDKQINESVVDISDNIKENHIKYKQEEQPVSEKSYNPSFLYKGNKMDKTKGLRHPSMGSGWIFRYIISLVFICVLMVACFLIVRGFRTKFAGLKKENDIHLLGKFSLDQRNTLVMIRTRNTDFMIGCGTNACNLIASFPSAEDNIDNIMENNDHFSGETNNSESEK